MDNGYRPCACRDCMEIAIGEPGALCHECKEAGCTPCDCVDPDRGCEHGECQSPTAYGCDELEG